MQLEIRQELGRPQGLLATVEREEGYAAIEAHKGNRKRDYAETCPARQPPLSR